MDLSLLQEIQEIEERELENKIKAEKRMESDLGNKQGGKKDLINRAADVHNSERKR